MESKVFRPLKAIRAKCLDCCCGQMKEVKECTITRCALWPYRMGRRPTPKPLSIRLTPSA